MNEARFFINMPVPADKFEAVCAVLAGVSLGAAGNVGNVASAPQGTGARSELSGNGVAGEQSSTSTTATSDASLTEPSQPGLSVVPTDGGEIDAHGHPWSADLHASTKGKTKDGLWRMKVGVSRPDPLPGFPVDAPAATGTSSETGTSTATSQDATAAANAQAGTAAEEEDEFAAFRNAAAASDANDEAAAASVPARQYSDADLGALCNQAAVKLGDPSPIKEIIVRYVPEGQVAHSRNIPENARADFVKEVETKAGIEFAG